MKKVLLSIMVLLCLAFCSCCLQTVDDTNKASAMDEELSLSAIKQIDVAKLQDGDNQIMQLIVNYLNTSFQVPEYYFPYGENGMFLVESDNGIFDFSDYYLHGDANFDGNVNEEDVHIMETAIKENNLEYDLNGDQCIDGKDMSIVVERLLTEAKSFSFYNKNKQPLDIAPIEFEEEKRIKFKTNDSIYVVVNDCNGHNAINSKHKKNLLFRVYDALNTQAYAMEIDSTIKQSIDDFLMHMDKTPDKYLLAWSCNIQAVLNTSVKNDTTNNVGLLTPYHDLLTSTFNEKVINRHFIPYNMLTETKIKKADYYWNAQAGMYTSNAMEEQNDIQVDLASYRFSDMTSHTTNDQGINKKFILTYAYYIKTLPTLDIAKGKVKIDGWDTVNGEITVHRAGPGENHDEIKLKTAIQNGQFESNDKIPSGDIVMDFYCEHCDFALSLSEDRAYYAPFDSLDVEIEERVKVYGTIVEEQTDEAIDCVKVIIESACKEMGNSYFAETTTDAMGKYEFLDVPYGVYDVRYQDKQRHVVVNERGKKEVEVQKIEMNETFDVYVTYQEYMKNTQAEARWYDVTIDLETKRNFAGAYLYTDGTKKMFNQFDQSNDGVIDLSEADQMPFSLIDANQDNGIMYDELTNFLDAQNEYGIYMELEPNEYEAKSNHPGLVVEITQQEELPFGLCILGIKSSNLDGYANDVSYEPNTVAVCWNVYYDIMTKDEVAYTEQPCATYLPNEVQTQLPTVFKSSIPVSTFKELIKSGTPVEIHDEVQSTVTGKIIAEYDLIIEPHK